jgi:hypothetical protein
MSGLVVHRRAVWFILALAAMPAVVGAQSYYDVLLTPSGYTNAAGDGISGVEEVGAAVNATTGYTTALFWPSSTTSAVNLGPSGWTFSQANAVSGNQQVGEGTYPNDDNTLSTNALLWTGTASSMVNLNPSGYTYSAATATDGTEQVGYGEQSGDYETNALLWTGTAASAVDLMPANYNMSAATGVYGNIQVGYGYGSPTGDYVHPLEWQGTAASATDILPSGYTDAEAMDVSGNQIVGFADNNAWGSGRGNYLAYITHAMLWNATTDAWTDLNPASGWTETFALGTNGDFQVGYGYGTTTGNEDHALVWDGNNSSFTDLEDVLPSNFVSSVATGIDPDGNIVGYAENNAGVTYSVEWVDPPAAADVAAVPEPGGLTSLGVMAIALLMRRGRQRPAFVS